MHRAVVTWHLLAALCIVNAYGLISNITYSRYTSLNGYDCAQGDLVMSSTGVRSHGDCMVMCKTQDDCYSVFYVLQNGNHMCHGCSANYTYGDIATLPALAGSIYYRPSGLGIGTCDWCDFTWGNSGYKMTTTFGTFPYGKDLCAGYGAYPNMVETEAEVTYILEQLNLFDPGNMWVGIYRAKAATEYVWNATGAVAMETWYPWSAGEPHHDNTDENCIMYYPIYSYQWVDVVNRCLYTSGKMLCEVDL